MNSLKSIETTYKELLNEKKNILEGYVISAIPMDDVKIKELESELSKKYNKNVRNYWNFWNIICVDIIF